MPVMLIPFLSFLLTCEHAQSKALLAATLTLTQFITTATHAHTQTAAERSFVLSNFSVPGFSFFAKILEMGDDSDVEWLPDPDVQLINEQLNQQPQPQPAAQPSSLDLMVQSQLGGNPNRPVRLMQGGGRHQNNVRHQNNERHRINANRCGGSQKEMKNEIMFLGVYQRDNPPANIPANEMAAHLPPHAHSSSLPLANIHVSNDRFVFRKLTLA